MINPIMPTNQANKTWQPVKDVRALFIQTLISINVALILNNP